MEAINNYFMQYPFDRAGLAQNLWLIIALPLLGALVSGVFGRALGRANTGLIACGAVAGSFLLSLLAFWAVADVQTRFASAYSLTAQSYAIGWDYGTWFQAGAFKVTFGLFVDHLSGTMLLVITGVGLLIHIYSTSYMSHDAAYWRYFAYLNLFVAMMLTLVLGDSLPLLFVGWEGVGLCSYLLIGFWYNDPDKAFAGRKAFIVNRIGDFAFLIGCFLLVIWMGAFAAQSARENFSVRSTADGAPRQERFRSGLTHRGPLNFQALEVAAKNLPASADRALGPKAGSVTLESAIEGGPLDGLKFGTVLTAVLLLFLLGAAGKSAQFPLYVWLPDAMAGPTPVSALIHAATMVTAGVYLFSRMSYLVVLSPTAMLTIAAVGAFTSLLAALIAFAQDDIKKVLAYSTVSQLGIMFMGVGFGVFWAAVLHLVTHAFFKACLFLGAGSVMHGNADETDIKKLGGVRREMRWTWLTFLVSTIAITGVLPLSGFFSKDAIFHGIHGTHLKGLEWATTVIWVAGLLAAFCTAFYMTRLYLLTFEGERSKEAKIPHAHESDSLITVPLMILAGLAVVAAVHGIPFLPNHETPMQNFLRPVFDTASQLGRQSGNVDVHPEEGVSLFPYILAAIIAWAGAGLAAFFYLRFFPSRKGQPAPAFARSVRRFAVNKFYVDELYDRVVVRPLRLSADVFHKVVDQFLIDRVMVRGTAWVTERTGSALRYLQTGDVQSYAAVMALALLAGAAYAVLQVLS